MSIRTVRSFAVAPLAVLACLSLGACSTLFGGQLGSNVGKQVPPPTSDHLPVVHHPRAIVRMQPDRSLEITTLVSRRGSRVPALRIVMPGDPAYDAILARTGPIAPGQQAAGYLPES